jgi:hypothetical protein
MAGLVCLLLLGGPFGAYALYVIFQGIVILWLRQSLIVDRREKKLLERVGTPFGKRRLEYPFRHFTAVVIVIPEATWVSFAPSRANGSKTRFPMMRLVLAGKYRNILLGQSGVEAEVRKTAQRFSDLLVVPVEELRLKRKAD